MEDLGRHLVPSPKTPDLGWDSTAWEPLDDYTDESLQQLRAEFEDTPFAAGPDEPATADGVMAEENQLRLERMDEIDQWSRELGVAPVRTLRDLLEFLLAAGVLSTTGAGDAANIRLNESAPLPGEILSLSDDERRVDDDLRWQRLHEPAAQALIDLFVPDGSATTVVRTSLQRLARQIDLAAESVRAGVLNLLHDGDFTASADVERLLEHQVFELLLTTALQIGPSIPQPGPSGPCDLNPDPPGLARAGLVGGTGLNGLLWAVAGRFESHSNAAIRQGAEVHSGVNLRPTVQQ